MLLDFGKAACLSVGSISVVVGGIIEPRNHAKPFLLQDFLTMTSVTSLGPIETALPEVECREKNNRFN